MNHWLLLEIHRGKNAMPDGLRDLGNIELPATEIPIIMETDVIVVGGGPSGFGSAICAARNGADTLLIDRFGAPGGNITVGMMPCAGFGPIGVVHSEYWERLEKEGYLYDIRTLYPNNLLYHSSPGYYGMYGFNPDAGACIMNQMLEEAGVRLLFRTLFVDAHVQDVDGEETIEAVIVENASGREAIKGKIFVDATGRGDLVAKAGAPFKDPGDEDGHIIPPGLMWRMSGVDLSCLSEYQENHDDPNLEKVMEKARSNGDIPKELYRPVPTNTYAAGYKGHPKIDCYPTGESGELTIWQDAPHEWNLNCALNAEDATRAEVGLRKLIIAESKFLKKYVPGFEKAWVSGIAPLLGIREGRHPIGEHVLTYEDIRNQRKFPDAALRRSTPDQLDFSRKKPKILEFEIPYRSFQARRVNNLLLAGETVSFEHHALFHSMRSFGMSVQTGEVAGQAAGLSVQKNMSPKKLRWTEPLG
jgi:hypothetical protein